MGQCLTSETKKNVLSDGPRPLPSTAYISLTEGISWIAYGDARDDEFFIERTNREANVNFEKWRDPEGPGWLLPHLELLEEGKTWEDVPEQAGYNLARKMEQLGSIERWLKGEGRDLNETIDEIVNLLKGQHKEAEPFHVAMDLVWQACAAEEVTLQGLIIDTRKRVAAGAHTSIPFRYFLRPVTYFWGSGPHGKGQLCPKPPDTEDELFMQVRMRPDDRVDYIDVLIRHGDVVRLRDKYLKKYEEGQPTRRSEREVQPHGRFSMGRLAEWYKSRVANWPPDTPPPSSDRDWRDAKLEFHGVPREAIRDLRRKHAPKGWRKQGRRPTGNSRK